MRDDDDSLPDQHREVSGPGHPGLDDEERADLLSDLEDLAGFQALLEPKGIRGLVVDCEGCDDEHFFGWELLKANLQQLLSAGDTHVHEPAFDPDPDDYVSWEYARGYADAVLDAAS